MALVGLLVQSLLLLPVPVLQGRVLDRVVPAMGGAGPAGSAVPMILVALAAMVACHVGRTVLGWAFAARMSRVSLEVVREVTEAMHRKIQRLPLSYHDRQPSGRVLARITSDVGSLLIFLDIGSLQLASDLVLAMGISAVLLATDWRLALATLAVMPLYALNQRLMSGRVISLAEEVRTRMAAVYGLLCERVSAVRVVRSFAQEEAELSEFDERLDEHRAVCWASMQAGTLQSAAATAVGGLGTVCVVAFGAALVARGSLTVGGLLAVYGLATQLHGPIIRLAGLQGMLAATRVAVDRMAEVLDEPEAVVDRPDARPVRRPRGAVAYRDVSFGYAPDARPVLQHVDLEIEPGMTVGILGPSGSGKSTLLALAPRLYDIADGRGSILLDGVDVRDLRAADLRKAVALVPQHAILFEGTVGSNLLYAAGGASDESIRRTLEAVDLASTIAALPQGLDTPVGERGLTLSGGQRQRLALARALIADPAVLLLDDCTSALDAETESRVRRALSAMRPGRTTVVVSHKAASLRHADLIVVLDDGRIVERGTHRELMASGDGYARTYRQQARHLEPILLSATGPREQDGLATPAPAPEVRAPEPLVPQEAVAWSA
jgi:ABC-type multidrug transport system fused ATPase/permease subunit